MAAADYQNLIVRGSGPAQWGKQIGDASVLIREDLARDIIDGVIEESAALRLMPHIRMPTKEQRIPVFAALPEAHWITGDTGLIKTTRVSWKNRYLVAEDMGVIVPIPKTVLEDTSYNIWAQVRPRLVEAIAKKLDQAVFFGIERPQSWPLSIAEACLATGNVHQRGTGVDLVEDINQVLAKVEEDGHEVTGIFYRMSLLARLRGLRDTNNALLFQPAAFLNPGGPKVDMIWGIKASTSKLGAFESQNGTQDAELLAGDFSQCMLGIRQDIEFTMLKEAVIFDDTGQVTYNLPQQRMVALMVTCRMAFQVANPINRLNPNENDPLQTGDRYPFAALIEP